MWAALQTGVSVDPAPTNPYSNDRKVSTSDGRSYFLGGKLGSYSLGQTPWGPIAIDAMVTVSPIGSDGIINRVTANGMTMTGPQLDLRNVNPGIDVVAGTWKNGDWFASLLIQSEPNRPDLMRVCWNTHLPPPPPLTGPPNVAPVVRTVTLKRLMCGIYNNSTSGPDVGGHVIDDFNGTVRTFHGVW